MGQILLPKYKVGLLTEKVIFLAGPISCAPPWRDTAIKYLCERNKNVLIASSDKRIKVDDSDVLKSEKTFDTQLEWERYYLEIASKQGAILFWLPNAVEYRQDRAYARDTRGELGEWRGRRMYDSNLNVVIGGESSFDGFDVIRRNEVAVIPNTIIYSTLEKTCNAALDYCRG